MTAKPVVSSPNEDAFLLPWFAVQVRSGRESYVASMLQAKSLPVFAPVQQRRNHRRNASSRWIHAPLFPGYLFCRLDWNRRLPVLETTWVTGIVSNGRVPTPIPEIEIASLQRVVKHGADPQPEEYAVGHRVRIVEGPLAGVEGVIRRTRNSCRITVSITLLQRAVSAEVDYNAVLPLAHAS